MARSLVLALFGIALAGCAGYTVGPTNGINAGSRSVEIRAFANRTAEPRISEYLASSFRKQLSQDGTFRLETQGAPDILVTGVIERFDRTELSYTTNDVLTPQAYAIVLTARVVRNRYRHRQDQSRPQGPGPHLHAHRRSIKAARNARPYHC